LGEGDGAGSPFNIMWPGPSPYHHVKFDVDPSNHVWPEYTNVTDRTGRTGNGPIAKGEPF